MGYGVISLFLHRFRNPFDVQSLVARMWEASMAFKDKLKELREKAGLSQAELAGKASLSVRSIQNWEQGHRGPSTDGLVALARALGVSMEALLVDGQSRNRPPSRKR